MAGNTLGARAAFKYVDDLDVEYRFFTDEDLGLAGNNDVSASNTASDLPRAFRPRGVHVVGKDNPSLKKFLVIGSRTEPLFATNASKEVTIDEVVFRTTGRRGESRTFRGGGAADPPPGGGGG